MHHVLNKNSQAVHATHGIHPVTLCKVKVTAKYLVTEKPVTCDRCKQRAKGGTKHHVTAVGDPVYQMTADIGGDLSDGAFWALYDEFGG